MVAGGKCHASGYSSAPVISVVTQLVNTHSVAYWHSVIHWYSRIAPLLNYLFSFPWLPVLAEPNFQKRASLPNNLASNSFQWQCFAWPMFETPWPAVALIGREYKGAAGCSHSNLCRENKFVIICLKPSLPWTFILGRIWFVRSKRQLYKNIIFVFVFHGSSRSSLSILVPPQVCTSLLFRSPVFPVLMKTTSAAEQMSHNPMQRLHRTDCCNSYNFSRNIVGSYPHTWPPLLLFELSIQQIVFTAKWIWYVSTHEDN